MLVHNSKQHRFVCLSLFVLAGTVVAYVQNLWHLAENTEADSTVRSLYSHLEKSQMVTTRSEEWVIVDDDSYDEIVKPMFISSVEDPQRTIRDPWGNRLHIAVRYVTPKQCAYTVWSAGPDGVSGSADDIVSWCNNVSKLPAGQVTIIQARDIESAEGTE